MITLLFFSFHLKVQVVFTEIKPLCKQFPLYSFILSHFRCSSKPRPLQNQHSSSHGRYNNSLSSSASNALVCNCSLHRHVNWESLTTNREMLRIIVFCSTAAFLLYINTIFADFAYDDRLVYYRISCITSRVNELLSPHTSFHQLHRFITNPLFAMKTHQRWVHICSFQPS